MSLNRTAFLSHLSETPVWDIIIVGGGATGLGTAVDAALRGYKTLLLEKDDFAKGTSSRSTKLVHGGVRYLANGDVALVIEALHERDLLLQNAPHLVHQQPFVIPCYSWFSIAKYGIGLKLYDLLAGKKHFKKSSVLSVKKVLEALPGLQKKRLKGGICYYDGQFDDSRLAINLAETAAENGAALLNYFRVKGLAKSGDKISGVLATDSETGKEYSLRAKVVVNATGVFVDEILKMDQPAARPLVRPSQGAHIVLDASFLPGKSALMIPKTPDGRVLFAVPWHKHILVGTTDTPLNEHSSEPVALDEEVDFILKTAGKYLVHPPKKVDILSVFAGLRPLAAPQKETDSTKEISRSHKLINSASGLITITGGKWTTYRKMAEDTVNQAIKTGGLSPVKCATKNKLVHGAIQVSEDDELAFFGTDAADIHLLMMDEPALAEKLHPQSIHTKAEVVWAARHEMARTVEDMLARRLRILFLDAKTAVEMAPVVAHIMASELQKDAAWENEQIAAFIKTASNYILVKNSQPEIITN